MFNTELLAMLLGFNLDDKIPNDLLVDLVEQTAYQMVKNNSPFENSERLQKIIEWVGGIQKNWNQNQENQLIVQKDQHN